MYVQQENQIIFEMTVSSIVSYFLYKRLPLRKRGLQIFAQVSSMHS